MGHDRSRDLLSLATSIIGYRRSSGVAIDDAKPSEGATRQSAARGSGSSDAGDDDERDGRPECGREPS